VSSVIQSPFILIPRALSQDAVRSPPYGHVPVELGGETMGTNWRLRAFVAPGSTADEIEEILTLRFDGLIAEFSTWVADAFISRFNALPPDARMKASPEFMMVLRAALAIEEKSNGAFSPWLGARIAAQGFGSPLLAEIAARNTALSSVDRETARACISSDELVQPGGLLLDLSAIAKGHAVDEAAAVLESIGARSFLMEIGGEFVGRGVKPDGSPWWVDIEADAGEPAGARIALCGLALATSGDAYAVKETETGRVSHIVSGAEHDALLRSVSVLHDSCKMADGWATALFAAGAEGFALAEREGLAAIFQHAGQPAHLTAAARSMTE
jgi:thiamine biosynthesis lipoprotein